ncbi:YMGG-like glycine zipper-containing protein [Radicibacter daui]|uniref:YMGG-like glycine zipper-containing protein n=1 Tax=Radicibacter daui TaxID=3064829 RepID=UPI004046B306
MIIRALFLGAAVLAVAACGEGTGHRALTGAGIGAGVGAVGSAVMGANPVTGALVGGGVGAATGALTNSKQIDLDK